MESVLRSQCCGVSAAESVLWSQCSGVESV